MRLSLALIVKDEKDQVQRILTDYRKYFDEICIAFDDKATYEFFLNQEKESNVKCYLYARCKEENDKDYIFFDRKRNFIASKVTGQYYVRIDTDDIIHNPGMLREVAEKAQREGIAIVYCWYEYSKDIHGNVYAAHYRETVVKNSPNLFWNKRIHENIIPKSPLGHQVAIEEKIKIEHMITDDRAMTSGKRNFKYLIDEYNDDPEHCDPRTLAYLGRMLFYTKEKEKAQYFLEKHIENSGWDEDRYASWCLLSAISLERGDFKDAIGCCNEAIAERAEYPEAYFRLLDIYAEQKKWKEAIHWGKIGLSLPMPKTFMLLDPSSYTWRPMFTMAIAYLQINEVEKAKMLFDKVKEYIPGSELILKNEAMFEAAFEEKTFIDNFIWMFRYLKKEDPDKLPELFKSVPHAMRNNEGIIQMQHAVMPGVIWPKKSIAIYCGRTPHAWSDVSVLKGLGGSEEAVVYLSRNFVKLGYEVTVYCNCEDMEGVYNGVTYKHTMRFNPKDEFNILIGWRANIFFSGQMRAKRKIVWLHDVPVADQFSEEEPFYDAVVVLSAYHKTLLPKTVPEDKIYISTNGINLPDFDGLDNFRRQPHRIIYASSYDRGLEDILNGWSKIREEVPDAELHVFYGWNTYDSYVELGLRDSKYKEKMVALMEQDGVYDHGRVAHRELLEEYTRARVFAYPTNFVGEINCIALTKAVACGCVAVTNDKYVLKERNPHIAVPDKEFIPTVIKALKGEIKYGTPIAKFRQENSWESVAKQWEQDLFQFKRNTYKDFEEYKKEYSGPKVFRPSNFDADGRLMVHMRYSYVEEKAKWCNAKSLFDVGCSDGALPLYIAGKLKIHTAGIEPDKRATEFATEYAKKFDLDCKFYTGIIEEFKPERKYDIVSALEVIEHVISPRDFLNKIESMVEPGGHVILSTPDKEGFYGEDNFNPQHINHFDKKDLEDLIGKDRIVAFKREGELIYVFYNVL